MFNLYSCLSSGKTCLKMDEVVRNRSQIQVNFGVLLFCLNNQDRSLVRNLEKLYRKQIQSSYGVVFNETCLNENSLPKYTDIYNK